MLHSFGILTPVTGPAVTTPLTELRQKPLFSPASDATPAKGQSLLQRAQALFRPASDAKPETLPATFASLVMPPYI